MKPYKLQLFQVITANDKKKQKQFCVNMQKKFEEEEFYECLVFSNETTIHTNGKVKKRNVHIWNEEIPISSQSIRGTRQK